MSDSWLGESDDSEPDQREVEELLEDLEELEETVESPVERRVILRTMDALNRLSGGRIFGLDDVAQQVVGGFILSAPFVVTEEVWSLATTMNWLQWAITVFMVVGVGYGTLYRTTDDRDPDQERAIAGVPLRFVSLLLISYLSVTTLALVFNAPETFGATMGTTAKAISIGAIFGVVGAATADTIF